jgi:membrane-bound lytic murein transglycosylase D
MSLNLKRRISASLKASVIVLSMTAFQIANVAQAAPFPPGFLKATPAPRPDYDSIPIESNAAVRRWVHYFTHENRERFDRFMERGARYRITVQEILEENGVPSEMYYLGMIESGYASQARSQARAVGIWQFIAPTARRYGLRVDKEVDERLDVLRSTKAAARYLKDLKNEFGSWYMAMAAYNCGEGRVRSAIRRHRTHDFWTLQKRRALPRETAEYIPKFQAAMVIARNPSKYGFQSKTHYEFPEFRRVKIRGQLALHEIAKRQKVSVMSLKALNPHLLLNRLPRARKGYDVWVVAGGRPSRSLQ